MSTSTQMTIEKKISGAPKTYLIVAGVLTVIGIAAWIYQLIRGMQVTGLSQQVVWGLYISAFFVAIGAGAGLLALVGLSEFKPILSLQERTKSLSLALASFIIACLLITMDIGNPLQIWRIITGFRFNSMMTWDFWLLVISGLVALVYLIKARKTESSQSLKTLGILAVVAAVVVVSVEGWMLSTLAARPMWGSGLTLVSFLVGAALGGFGLALLIFHKEKFPTSSMAFVLVLNLVLVLAEVLTGLLTSDPRVHAEMAMILSSSVSIFFWFQLIFGLVVPLYLLLKQRSLAWAGGLAIAGVLSEKVWLLAAGQAQPWTPQPAISYLPSWVEFLAVIGAVALCVLIYKLIRRWTAVDN